MLAAWQQLLLAPRTTLPAAGCLRGQLLSLVAAMIEEVVAAAAAAGSRHKPPSAGGDGHEKPLAVLIAVLRLLELNPNIARCVCVCDSGC